MTFHFNTREEFAGWLRGLGQRHKEEAKNIKNKASSEFERGMGHAYQDIADMLERTYIKEFPAGK